jgi:hypothetical protein
LTVAVCGIAGAPSCGPRYSAEYPLPLLTQTLVRHPTDNQLGQSDLHSSFPWQRPREAAVRQQSTGIGHATRRNKAQHGNGGLLEVLG